MSQPSSNAPAALPPSAADLGVSEASMLPKPRALPWVERCVWGVLVRWERRAADAPEGLAPLPAVIIQRHYGPPASFEIFVFVPRTGELCAFYAARSLDVAQRIADDFARVLWTLDEPAAEVAP